MVIDLTAAERHPALPCHAAKQLQETTIAGPVNAAGPRNRDLDSEPRAGFARQPLAFQLRRLVVIARIERSVLAGWRMLDVAMDAHRTAVDDAPHTGGRGRFDKVTDRGCVDSAIGVA